MSNKSIWEKSKGRGLRTNGFKGLMICSGEISMLRIFGKRDSGCDLDQRTLRSAYIQAKKKKKKKKKKKYYDPNRYKNENF